MIIEFEEKLLEMIDARIETASDDELFAVGTYVDIFLYLLLRVKKKASMI